MADWGIGGGGVITPAGIDAALSSGPSINSGSGAKGAWVELIAAANNRAGDWNGFNFIISCRDSVMDNYAMDIGIGESGVEVVVLSNFKYSAKNSGGTMAVFVPLRIPGGVRVSVRAASASANPLRVQVIGFTGAFSSVPVFGNADSMGISATNGNGVDVDPGGDIHTKGAWVEIVASTAHHYKVLMLIVGSSDNSSQTTHDSKRHYIPV